MRVDARGHAVRLLSTLPHDHQLAFANDADSALRQHYPEFIIVDRDPGMHGGCSIDGLYRAGPPPTIEVATDTSPARRQFTLLHEFGHHLIEHDEELADLPVADTDRRDEDIYDHVAAMLLIPDRHIQVALENGPRASSVLVLRRRTSASRAACCVAVAQRLGRPGCVMFGWPDGVAEFVAHHPATPWTVARGTPQGPDSPLVRGPSAGPRSPVVFRGGNRSGPLWVDTCTATDGRTIAVFIDDTISPWARANELHLPEVTAPAYEEVECPRCDAPFEAHGAPCRMCGDYTCPECRTCSCRPGATSTKRCPICTMTRPADWFEGNSDACHDCL